MATPWSSPSNAANELNTQFKAVDYASLAEDVRILFFGDEHSNSEIHTHLLNSLPTLKSAKITHLAIEAPHVVQPQLDMYCSGKSDALDNIDIGPVLGMKDLVSAATQQGWKVHAIDVDQTHPISRLERDGAIAKNILTAINNSEAGAKFAILLGRFHSARLPGTAATIIEKKDFKITRINFAGGKTQGEFIVDAGARMARLEEQEFMIDLRLNEKYVPYGVPFGGHADVVIHLPQIDQNNRASNSIFLPMRSTKSHFFLLAPTSRGGRGSEPGKNEGRRIN